MADKNPADAAKSDPSPGLTLEARDWIETRIRAEFDRDRAFLKETLGFAAKALGIAASVLLVVITIAGFRTYKQVNDAIISEARAQVKASLRSDDPESSFSRTRDQLVASAIIDSYRLRISRANASSSFAMVEVDRGDRDRLLKVVTNPDTPAEAFSDAVDILALVSTIDEKARGSELYAILGDLVRGAGKYSWMRLERTRRIALLDAMHRAGAIDQLNDAIESILAETSLPIDVLDKCLEVVEAPASDKLLRRVQAICDEREYPIAFVALAVIDPSDLRLQKHIQALRKDPTNESVAELLQIASAAVRPRGKSVPHVGEIAQTTLQLALNHGFELTMTRTDRGERTIRARCGNTRRTIDHAFLDSPDGVEAANALLASASERQLRLFIPALVDATVRSLPTSRLSLVTADLTRGGALVVEHGNIEKRSHVRFYVTAGSIVAQYKDDFGNMQSGRVIELKDRTLIKFALTDPNDDTAAFVGSPPNA